MAKDPAFLFYPNDWQGGTMTMSRHLKGCYLDLLVAQFNSGPLSLEEIKIVLGNDFAVWGSLSKKFAYDAATGKFSNKRLELEKMKREEFAKKQKERIKQRWKNKPPDPSIGNTAVLPVEDGNENEIENRNEIQGGAGGIPSQAMVEQVFNQAGLTADDGEEFYLFVSGTRGWKGVNNWRDYVMSAITKKLKEKKQYHGNVIGNNANRAGAQKRSLDALEQLAREVLQQP